METDDGVLGGALTFGGGRIEESSSPDRLKSGVDDTTSGFTPYSSSA